MQVHNGKTFHKIKITQEMIGHKFGEFARTRKQAKHKALKQKNIRGKNDFIKKTISKARIGHPI